MEEKEEAAPHVAEKQCQQQWAAVPNQEHFIGAEPQCKRPVEEEEAEKQDRQAASLTNVLVGGRPSHKC